MEKSKIISLVIIAAVIIVGGYLAFSGNKTSNNREVAKSDTSTNGNNANTESGKKVPFNAFVRQGGSYKCDVKQNVSDMQNDGTVYINNGNIRGDYNTVAEGKTIDTSFLLQDGYSYTWSSMMPGMGFKTKIATTASPDGTTTNPSGTYSWNADQIGDYNCQPWTLDESKFTLPTNITFKAIGS